MKSPVSLRLSLCAIFFLIRITLSGQCPDKADVFRDLNLKRENPTTSRAERIIKVWNDYKRCYPQPDSNYVGICNAACFAYYNEKNYIEAIRFAKMSVLTLSKHWPARDSASSQPIAYMYYNLSVFYDSLRNMNLKMAAIDSCLALEQRFDNDYYSAFLLRDKIEWLYNKGDYGQCVEYSVFGRKLIAKQITGVDSLESVVFILCYQAQALSEIGQIEAANQLLRQAVILCLKRKGSLNLGTTYNISGELLRASGKTKEALTSFRNALNADLRTGRPKGCAEALANLADLNLVEFSRPDSALFFARAALKYSDNVDSLRLYGLMGTAMAKSNLFDSALALFQIAFEKIAPGADVHSIHKLPLTKTTEEKSTAKVTELLINYANAWYLKYQSGKRISDLEKSIIAYKTADLFIDSARSEHLEFRSKLFWRQYAKRLYENAIEACYILNDAESLFYFFERSKAVLLNDNLSAEKSLSEEDQMKLLDLNRIERDLRARLLKYNPGTTEYIAAENELYAHLLMSQNFIRQSNKLIVGSVKKLIRPTIAIVRETLLTKHEALIEIFVGDSAVYVYSITANDTRAIRVSRTEYNLKTAGFLQKISKAAQYRKEVDDFILSATALYNLIFQPLNLGEGRIIISPDGEYFPFEALVTSNSGADIQYLLRKNSITYAYSAGHLLNSQKHSIADGKDFAGFAPVNYKVSQNLAALIKSDESLEKIGAYFDQPSTFRYAKASLQNFEKNFTDFQIIHLYTHAVGKTNSDDPVIYFQDQKLNLNDLAPSKIPNTSLIVLAACESGLGRLYNGEGVFSFNRAFAAIGIPSAVVNLWTVENKATYQLTESFYKYLCDGFELDIALQKAKLDYISTATPERQLPYYWAASVLTGSPAAIELKNHSQGYLWLSVVGVSIFLLGIVYWARTVGKN